MDIKLTCSLDTKRQPDTETKHENETISEQETSMTLSTFIHKNQQYWISTGLVKSGSDIPMLTHDIYMTMLYRVKDNRRFTDYTKTHETLKEAKAFHGWLIQNYEMVLDN